jgi:DnaJ homolog subfamily C member 17
MSDELPPNFDIYAFLSIPPTATEAEIRSAYRKHSLLYHPDKNPSPSAVQKFHYLNLANEILSSPSARAAYDNVHRARAAKAQRSAKYDDERKRMQQDLEYREQNAKRRKFGMETNTGPEEDVTLREAVEKLKEESERLKLERDKRIREDLIKQERKDVENDESERTIKVRFRKGVDRASLSTDKLEAIFSEYGRIQNIILGKSALIIYEDRVGAQKALAKLIPTDALARSIVKEITMANTMPLENNSTNHVPEVSAIPSEKILPMKPSVSTVPPFVASKFTFKATSHPGNDVDYEATTLMRMRKLEKERLEREILEQEEREEKEEMKV